MTPEELIAGGGEKVKPDEIKELAGSLGAEEVSEEKGYDGEDYNRAGIPPRPEIKKEETLPKKVEALPKEEKKEEKKEEETLPKKEEEDPTKEEEEDFIPKPLELPTKKETPLSPSQRDYSDLSEAEVALAKKMSNESFNYFKAKISENRKLLVEKKQLEEKLLTKPSAEASYLDHEQGFILNPDYQEAVKTIGNLEREKNHWAEQLERIENGEEWENVETGPDNNLILKKYPASTKAKIHVTSALQRADNTILRAQGFVQEYAQKFKGVQQSRAANLNRFEQEFFPMYNDPEFLAKNRFAKGLATKLSSQGIQSVPISLACKLYAYTMEIIEQQKKEASGGDKSKGLAEIKKGLGPSNTAINTGSKAVDSDGDSGYNPDVFAKARRF